MPSKGVSTWQLHSSVTTHQLMQVDFLNQPSLHVNIDINSFEFYVIGTALIRS